MPDENATSPTDKASPGADRLRRLELWLGFWKFVLASFVLALITAILNYQIQSRTVAIKAKEQEKEYLKSFIQQAMDDNLEKRVRFAQYFAALLREGWTEYYKELSKEFDAQKAIVETAKAEQLKLIPQQDSAARARVEELARHISVLEANLTPQLPRGQNASRTTDTFNPECTLPFAGVRNPPIDDNCGIAGGSLNPAKQAESVAKNNFCAATQSPRVITYQELISLQNQSANVAKNLADRTMLGKMGEGQYVSYVAFIKDAHYADVAYGEPVNCNLPGIGTNDIHIVLMKDAEDNDECHSTTAEMSPHYRPPEWIPGNLVTASKGHPVRVQGQLFFDGNHTPCSGTSRSIPKRASLWEIHPVYSVDVCSKTTIAECQSGSSAEWTPLSKFFISNQQ